LGIFLLFRNRLHQSDSYDQNRFFVYAPYHLNRFQLLHIAKRVDHHHLHHQDLWPEFWAYLENIKNENLDIFVTVNNPHTEWYEDIVSKCTDVFLVENKGMDFGGFLFAYNKIKHIDYKLIIKLHGKKRNSYLLVPPDEWRKYDI
jgi:lipopolysaccharide biosynthesis protein